MATDATGTPTSLGIPTFTTAGDAPTGRGVNAMMAAIDDLLVASTVNMPVATVLPFAGESAPDGWLMCDGTAYSTTTYAALFAVISSNFGAGGAGTFRVPDMRGRIPVGAGSGAGLTARSVAASGGVEAVTLTSAQSGLPAHGHNVRKAAGGSDRIVSTEGTGAASASLGAGAVGNIADYVAQNNTAADAASSHTNMQPFMVLSYIIKT